MIGRSYIFGRNLPTPEIVMNWSFENSSFFSPGLGSPDPTVDMYITRKRDGIQETILYTNSFSYGSIPYGVDGLMTGDQIKIGISSYYPENTGITASINLIFSRSPINYISYSELYNINDENIDAIITVIPALGSWYTIDPDNYKYSLSGIAG